MLAPAHLPDVVALAQLEAAGWASRLDALEASGTPLNAVTLAQAALLSEDEFQADVLERFAIASPVLDRLPFKSIDGNAYRYNAEATLPGVEFRAVNAAYTESTGTVVQATEGLVILGGDADVDTFIQATRSNRNDQVNVQVALKVKAAAYKFQDAFFNGDVAVDANSFDGMKKRITGGQIVDAGTDGIPVVGNGGTDIQTFLDVLDRALSLAKVAGDNGAIYANDLIRARIVSAARRVNLVDASIYTINDQTKRLESYRGTPVLDPGLTAAGVRILPQTETQGAAAGTASSAYVVRFGDDESDQAVTGLFNGNHEGASSTEYGVFAVKRLGEQQAKPAFRVRIEGFLGVAMFGPSAAVRVRGLLAA